MSMRFVWILVLLTLPVSAVAQDGEGMEMQRCIWRCLAGSPGAASAQYNQCVEDFCVGMDDLAEDTPAVNDGKPVPPPQVWSAGIASDGVHRFAGIDRGQGYGFYYLCAAQGASYFTLSGLPLNPGQMQVMIGGVRYLVPFDASRGDLSVNIPPATAFFEAVAAGDRMDLLTPEGDNVLTVTLVGAREALAKAVAGCFP